MSVNTVEFYSHRENENEVEQTFTLKLNCFQIKNFCICLVKIFKLLSILNLEIKFSWLYELLTFVLDGNTVISQKTQLNQRTIHNLRSYLTCWHTKMYISINHTICESLVKIIIQTWMVVNYAKKLPQKMQ